MECCMREMTKPISIKSRWIISAVGLVAALVSFWGVDAYVAKHQRENVAPQRLFDHLFGVHAGDLELDVARLSLEPFRQAEQALVETGLTRDLTQSGHPDPPAATLNLLAPATRHLLDDETLRRLLTERLRMLPDDWRVIERTPVHWRVQAGGSCLELAYQDAAPEERWRWIAIGRCPGETG